MDGQDIDNLAQWHIAQGEPLSRLLVDETASMKVSALAARLDRAKRRNGIDVVWIDYIGLLQPSEKQRPGYDRMTAISNELRVLAKEIDLPFAVLAQLSRPVKGAAVAPPKLTDLSK
jgi:replicative DNA helicase